MRLQKANMLRTFFLAMVVSVGSFGCAREVAFDLDFGAQQALFLHADTITITTHALVTNEDAGDACARLNREAISSTGFTLPVESRYGPTPACEILRGTELSDLPQGKTHFVATASDAAGHFVAYGCAGAVDVDRLPVNTKGVPRIQIVLTPSPFYLANLADTAPPFASIEARCGVAPAMP